MKPDLWDQQPRAVEGRPEHTVPEPDPWAQKKVLKQSTSEQSNSDSPFYRKLNLYPVQLLGLDEAEERADGATCLLMLQDKGIMQRWSNLSKNL